MDNSAAKKPRGRPFTKGDSRINREGLSKDELAAKNLAREVARAVALSRVGQEPEAKTRLTIIFEKFADLAQTGGLVEAEFLLKWAFGAPPREQEDGAGEGTVIFDIGSAVARRAAATADASQQVN